MGHARSLWQVGRGISGGAPGSRTLRPLAPGQDPRHRRRSREMAAGPHQQRYSPSPARPGPLFELSHAQGQDARLLSSLYPIRQSVGGRCRRGRRRHLPSPQKVSTLRHQSKDGELCRILGALACQWAQGLRDRQRRLRRRDERPQAGERHRSPDRRPYLVRPAHRRNRRG